MIDPAPNSADDAAQPPGGFQLVQTGGTFAVNNGPLFARWHEGHFELGLRVETRHTNPGLNCHGGMLATLADIVLSSAAHYQTDIARQFLPTISLQIDFMAVAPLGSWVHGRADILKVTRNMIFSQGLLLADGQTVLRASGVFKRGPLLADTGSDHALTLPGMPQR